MFMIRKKGDEAQDKKKDTPDDTSVALAEDVLDGIVGGVGVYNDDRPIELPGLSKTPRKTRRRRHLRRKNLSRRRTMLSLTKRTPRRLPPPINW